jgi:hypothetical protein
MHPVYLAAHGRMPSTRRQGNRLPSSAYFLLLGGNGAWYGPNNVVSGMFDGRLSPLWMVSGCSAPASARLADLAGVLWGFAVSPLVVGIHGQWHHLDLAAWVFYCWPHSYSQWLAVQPEACLPIPLMGTSMEMLADSRTG